MGKWSMLKDEMVKFQEKPDRQEKINEAKAELDLLNRNRGDVGAIYADLRRQKEKLEARLSDLGVQLSAIDQHLISDLEDNNEISFKTEDGTFSIKDEPYSSVVERNLLVAYIKETGQEDLLSVNHMTVSSINKGLLEAGKQPMPGTSIYMKSTIQFRKKG